MSRRLAFLGPPGTFSEEAALRYDPKAQLLPFISISAVAAAMDSGMADEGIVPIENSLEGSVPETLDILIHDSRLSVCDEVVAVTRTENEDALRSVLTSPAAYGPYGPIGTKEQ